MISGPALFFHFFTAKHAKTNSQAASRKHFLSDLWHVSCREQCPLHLGLGCQGLGYYSHHYPQSQTIIGILFERNHQNKNVKLKSIFIKQAELRTDRCSCEQPSCPCSSFHSTQVLRSHRHLTPKESLRSFSAGPIAEAAALYCAICKALLSHG